MLLHIGEDRFVPTKAVVAIVPADGCGARTERLIRDCVDEGRYYPSHKRPKAYVVCEREGTTYVYASSTAVPTLKERMTTDGKYGETIWKNK